MILVGVALFCFVGGYDFSLFCRFCGLLSIWCGFASGCWGLIVVVVLFLFATLVVCLVLCVLVACGWGFVIVCYVFWLFVLMFVCAFLGDCV